MFGLDFFSESLWVVKLEKFEVDTEYRLVVIGSSVISEKRRGKIKYEIY